VILKLKEKRFD